MNPLNDSYSMCTYCLARGEPNKVETISHTADCTITLRAENVRLAARVAELEANAKNLQTTMGLGAQSAIDFRAERDTARAEVESLKAQLAEAQKLLSAEQSMRIAGHRTEEARRVEVNKTMIQMGERWAESECARESAEEQLRVAREALPLRLKVVGIHAWSRGMQFAQRSALSASPIEQRERDVDSLVAEQVASAVALSASAPKAEPCGEIDGEARCDRPKGHDGECIDSRDWFGEHPDAPKGVRP